MNGKKAKMFRAWAKEFPNVLAEHKVHKRVKLFREVTPDGKAVLVPTKVDMIQLVYPPHSQRCQYQHIKREWKRRAR